MSAPSPKEITALVHLILPASVNYSVTRVDQGVSTYVFRITDGSDGCYLRVLPEPGASFAPEARAHSLLCQRGLNVPDVVFFEHLNAELQRSIMATTEIAGEHVGLASRRDVKDVLVEAGRELAVINSVPVHGFGWIKRDREVVVDLEAEHPSYRSFALEDIDARLASLELVLDNKECLAIRETIDRYASWLDVDHGRLAHGDFDVTHIFQKDGRYTGIIDFGEIRGGDPFYDLGHFRLHDGETLPDIVLPYLLEGYGQVTSLPPDHEWRIAYSSLLIGVRWLARTIEKSPDSDPRDHQAVRSIRRDIAFLNG